MAMAATEVDVLEATAADEEEEDDEDADDELLELPLPESMFTRDPATASVNSVTELPQKVIWRLTSSDIQAR